MAEVVSEMDYLRIREQKLRDTNESTNNRVKWFGFMTTFLLIALWGWQIMYLRAYFRWVTAVRASRPLLELTISATGRSILFNMADRTDGFWSGSFASSAWGYSQSRAQASMAL